MKFIQLKKVMTAPLNGQLVYLGILSFYLFFSFLRNTTFDPYLGSRVFNVASYVTVLLLITKFCFFDLKKNSRISLIITSILFLIAVVVWHRSNSNLILVETAFILAARNVAFDEIVKRYFYVVLVLLVLVVFFSLLGVIKDLVFVVHGRAVRYSLGIIYPTDLAAHILYLLLAHAYLNFSKLNWRYYCGYLVIAYLVKMITDARLSVLCIVLMIPILMSAKLAQKNKDSLSYHLLITYWMYIPLLAFTIFAGTYFFDAQNKIYFKIDRLLSGRLGYGHLAMDLYSVTLWGQKIVEHGLGGSSGLQIFHRNNAGYFFIDSSYLRLIMIYGIVAALVYILIMVFVSIKGVKLQVYQLTAVMLVVTLSCLVEQHLLELSFNPFLLALLANILCEKGKENEKSAFNFRKYSKDCS
ncbi:MAG: polymerase [Limosilactobacillus pontis]|uniref:Polymerase n=1 Tax=Limosilactobacillus pontis TaxID=35787 RepID=A0A2J6NNG5_9LACO|nr:polymerase [Limosilactobacillus pontis]PMB82776.1 polymerase [Limosilactobacillus pontis]